MEKLLTPAEAGEMLNFSPYTIREKLRNGEIKAHKVGKQWRISSRDIEAYLKRCAAGTQKYI